DTMDYMPRTREWFGAGGTTYANAFATTPLCCPARAGIMSGRFSHNNGVINNATAHSLAQGATIQAYLQDAGYRTALVGKYLNGWGVREEPPHFDDYLVLNPNGESYYGNNYNDNGISETNPDYSTDVIRDRAVDLIQSDFGGVDHDPWLMFVTPFAPHGPWEPAARHLNVDVGSWAGNPAVFERDKRDKPQHVRRARRDLASVQHVRQGMLRTLLAVDEMVDEIFQTIEAEGEEDTLAFFASDNGFHWAEHGLATKNYPYTESIRVPMMARWPGHIPAGQTDQRLVANIDIPATVLDATGIPPDPAFPLDGRSLLDPASRSKMLTEGWTGTGGWASIRTPQYQFIELYDEGGGIRFREYYDLRRDPWQLRNLFGDRRGRNDPFVRPLRRDLAAARACAGTTGTSACTLLLDQPGIPIRCPGGGRRRGHHMVGSAATDRMRGTKFREVSCGLEGNDRLRGARGDDRLIGGLGVDVLVGGPGDDILIGKGERDVCRGGTGRDRYRGCEVTPNRNR
ncbi:MAG: sulfatase-like hydrolase/transferase, partial [Actinomycetota bacterium]